MSRSLGIPVAAVRERVAAARNALLGWQQSDGGFPLLRWSPTGAVTDEDCLFATAAVLLAVGDQLPAEQLRSALALLRRRRGAHGLWHFDAAAQLPPDADDTAHVLAALLRFAPATERPGVADVARLEAFVQPNGRIATWFARDYLGQASTDDAVVAANVIYAMALSQPATARVWLQRWLRRNYFTGAVEIGSPYYVHIETVWYVWARALGTLGLAGWPSRTTSPVVAFPDRSPLRCALELSITVHSHDALAAALLRSQGADGGWPAEPWFRAPGALFGSAAVTTALALEGLLRWQRQVEACLG